MSLPRVLVLGTDDTLNMAFLPELAALRGKGFSLPPTTTSPEVRNNPLQGFVIGQLATEIELRAKRQLFSLTLTSNSRSICTISFDPSKCGGELRIAEKSVAVPPTTSGEHKFHLYFDASVVECLADHSAALTARVYTAPRGPITVSAGTKDLQSFSSLNVWEVKPISKDRLTS